MKGVIEFDNERVVSFDQSIALRHHGRFLSFLQDQNWDGFSYFSNKGLAQNLHSIKDASIFHSRYQDLFVTIKESHSP